MELCCGGLVAISVTKQRFQTSQKRDKSIGTDEEASSSSLDEVIRDDVRRAEAICSV
jgi:hypothetical protein